MLEGRIAGNALLQVRRNRVEVRGVGAIGQVGAGPARLVDQLLEDEMRAIRTLDLEHGIERVDPFAGLEGIDVLKAVHGRLFGLAREGGRRMRNGKATNPIRPNRIMTGNPRGKRCRKRTFAVPDEARALGEWGVRDPKTSEKSWTSVAKRDCFSKKLFKLL